MSRARRDGQNLASGIAVVQRAPALGSRIFHSSDDSTVTFRVAMQSCVESCRPIGTGERCYRAYRTAD
jgi:hypothetical protein